MSGGVFATLPPRYRWLGRASLAAFAALTLGGLIAALVQDGRPPSIRTGFNAALYTLDGRGDVHIDQLRKAVAIAVNERHAHRYNLAIALAGAGELDEAIEQLQAALAIKPDYAQAHRDLGGLLLRRASDGASLGAAVEHLEAAVRIDPSDAAAWVVLGNTLGRAGRWAPAAAAYREALARGMREPAAHHNLGVVLRKLGDEAGARAQFEAALAIDPGYARSRAALGG